MKIEVMNPNNGEWEELTAPRDFIRLVADGIPYIVDQYGNGLRISVDRQISIQPAFTNSIIIDGSMK